MFKRLMIGLLALSVFAIWVAPDADARRVKGKRSRNGVLTEWFADTEFAGATIVDRLVGEGENCAFEGTLYCEPVNGNGLLGVHANIPANNTEDNGLGCQIGLTAARVTVIDNDMIGLGPPNWFTRPEINNDIKNLRQREQLRFFANAAAAAADDPAAARITLRTGRTGYRDFCEDDGWFDLTTIPESWNWNGPSPNGLENFVGVRDHITGNIEVGNGLGSWIIPQRKLGWIISQWKLIRVPGVTPVDLTELEVGEQVCAVVHSRDVRITRNGRHGKLTGRYRGRVAFTVLAKRPLSTFSHGEIDIEILNADYICENQTLYIGNLEGQEGECNVTNPDETPPIPLTEGSFQTESSFDPENCSEDQCVDEYVLLLDEVAGQNACDELYGEDNTIYKDFVPSVFWAETVFDPVSEPPFTQYERCEEGDGLQYDCTEILDPNLFPTCDGDECTPLYEQSPNSNLSGAFSNTGGQVIADEFTLSAETDSSIESIKWYGYYGKDLDPTTSTLEFDVRFFYNAYDGGPGSAFYDQQVLAQVLPTENKATNGATIYEFQIDLDPPAYACGVEPFWISIAEDDDSTARSGDTQWLWSRSATGEGTGYAFESDPWTLVPDQGDFAFELCAEPYTCIK